MLKLQHSYFILVLVAISCSPQKSIYWEGPSVDFNHGKLEISSSGKYLQHEDKTPFLYLGDTAWELLSRLNEKEVEFYLEDRRKKGFTVIQTVIMDELDGIMPDSAYFEWIDKVLNLAKEKGLYVGLLPTWGDRVDKKWGKGPEIFTAESAYEYGFFLGKRYAHAPNIIWIIGGDRGGDGKNAEIWKALAKGIKANDRDHLMTYHPQGEHSSSFWFHEQRWLDFNMFQSGHAQSDYGIYKRLLLPDLNRSPRKPVMDGEPRYENIPGNFKEENRRFDDSDIRMSLYQSMFSGACGYTYGCNDVWQMYDVNRTPVIFANTPWHKALDFPGATQIIHFRRLIQDVDFFKGSPAPFLIKGNHADDDFPVAFKADDYILLYMPFGTSVAINLPDEYWDKKKRLLYWMNPRTGEKIKKYIEGVVTELTPPTRGKGNDWIAIIKN